MTNMAKKKKGSSLQAALNHVKPTENDKVEPVVEPAKASKRPSTALKPPSRKGTVQVAAHLPPEYAKQLRMLAAEDDTTNQALIQEALELLFLKKGKETIFGEK